MGFCFQGRGCGGNGTSAANGGSHPDKIGGIFLYFQDLAQKDSQTDPHNDPGKSIKETIASGTQYFNKIHTETHSHNGCPQ